MEETQKVMKYKVGDRVVIKDNTKSENEIVNGCIFVREMIKYKGMKAEIIAIAVDGYRLDVDDSRWCWVDEFFEDESVEDDILSKITTMKNRLKELEEESNRIKNELILMKNALNEI